MLLTGGWLAWLDHKHMSLRDIEYNIGSMLSVIAIIIQFVMDFRLAFVEAIIGIAIYLVVRWYLKMYLAEADRRLIMLALIAFPLQASAGLCLTALRAVYTKKHYFPVLPYFYGGFALLALIMLGL